MRRDSGSGSLGWVAAAAAMLLIPGSGSGPAAAAESVDDLLDSWRGATVLTRTAAYSDCSGSYTDTEVRGGLASGRGDFRFAAGEVARVHKMELERKKLEIFLDLDEPLLAPWSDGPFTLYDERWCKVELEVALPGRRSRLGAAELEALILGVVERHPDPQAARAAAGWSGRRREPLPADYERTVAEHRVWKASQVNLAVGEAIRRAVVEAARIADGIDDDAEYLEGLAEGARRSRREWRSGECDRLLEQPPDPWVQAPKEGGARWRDGYVDGWKLVFHLERGRRLHDCFLVPPPPA